ncbi:hypothetical protein BT93_F2893 [Corymbia citriodora subsp. variegata]|nr:hypothetical protein BT93_F2893 [Corymbia citriodora subsp. variegata]
MYTQAKRQVAPRQKGIVHIRTQEGFGGDEVQMSSQGCFLGDRHQVISWGKANSFVTTVEGLDEKLKHDVILSDLKKMLRCNGDKYRTDEAGVVIRLNTIHTKQVKDFLWKNGLAAKDKISCTPCV